jgi:hypothetical protein
MLHVLNGDATRMIDRWMGGVHLTPRVGLAVGRVEAPADGDRVAVTGGARS